MKADFHMHTVYSSDCGTPPRLVVERCRAAGLDCIAITDHNNIRGALEVREMADFTVIIGEEVMSGGGEIIGLFLEEAVPKGLSPEETIKRIKDQGGLVQIPHPYDRIRRGPLTSSALEQVLPQADLIEVFNARTILPKDLLRCRDLAERSGVTPVAVSDSHTLGEIGSAYLEMADFDGSPPSLMHALKDARINGRRSSPLVHLVTAYVKLRKKLVRS